MFSLAYGSGVGEGVTPGACAAGEPIVLPSPKTAPRTLSVRALDVRELCGERIRAAKIKRSNFMRSSIRTLVLAALTVGSLVAAPAAFAAPTDELTQTVDAGSRTASVDNDTMSAITTKHTSDTTTADLTLNVDDLSGTGVGWNVTLQVSDFVYSSGGNGGTAIDASNFQVTPGTVTGVAGASTVGVTPVTAPVTLETQKKVLFAEADSGVGAYTHAIDSVLTVPADSRAGTYTGTLTTSIGSGPGA